MKGDKDKTDHHQWTAYFNAFWLWSKRLFFIQTVKLCSIN